MLGCYESALLSRPVLVRQDKHSKDNAGSQIVGAAPQSSRVSRSQALQKALGIGFQCLWRATDPQAMRTSEGNASDSESKEIASGQKLG